MAKRSAWLTPDSLPAETICRALAIPDTPRMLAAVTGALYPLTFASNWEQFGAATPAETASACLDMLLAFLSSECEGGALFDLRVSPTDGCSIEKSVDGETWTEVFRLDTTCSLERIRRDPVTGGYGYDIEGVGFYRFPDGDWGASVINPPHPPDTHAAQQNPKCIAAANAAKVYVELYARVADELLDVVASEFELAANLGTAISGFLFLIGAAATQPYVAVASILGLIGVRQQFVDNPLDANDELELMCLFLNNAALHGDGSVTFNYDNVWAGVSLTSPKNTLIRLLMTMLGPDAMNYAGSVDFITSADCSGCAQDWVIQPAGEGGTVIQYEGDNWWLLRSTVMFGNHKISMGFKLADNPSLYGCSRIYDLEMASGPYTFTQLTRRGLYSPNCGCNTTAPGRGSTGLDLDGTWPSPRARGLFFGDMGSQFSVRVKLGPCVIP